MTIICLAAHMSLTNRSNDKEVGMYRGRETAYPSKPEIPRSDPSGLNCSGLLFIYFWYDDKSEG